MNKSTLAQFIKATQATAYKHAPEILMGIGIAGMLGTTVLAVKATPKALRLIEQARKKKTKPLTKVEKAKACWKCYIPTAITATASTVCLIGSASVSARRTAAIAAAYQISETALTEYRDKVVETIGEKKEERIRDEIDKDHMKKNPVSTSEVIVTEKGNTLCYDSLSGRYFRSDIDKISKAVNTLNRRMTYDVYVSLSELYDELDLDHTIMSDDLGWNLDGGLIEVDFGSQIAEDGTPCVVVRYNNRPRYDFSRLS